MNPAERKIFDTLDNLVLNASDEELKKIQEVDLETQLIGKSFYDEYLDSVLINQSIKQETRDFKK